MTGTVDFNAGYQRRIVDTELDLLMPHLPAILLDGPKGVGKTSTALQRCTFGKSPELVVGKIDAGSRR